MLKQVTKITTIMFYRIKD